MKRLTLIALVLCFSMQTFADSLDIKIGQMIMMGMYGTSVTPKSSIYKYAQQGIVGGVLLYERNVHKTQAKTKMTALCNTLQSAPEIPLLISIDQEGGQVNRLKTKYGFKPMPSAYSVAQKNNSDYTQQIANRIASACSNLGINVNYAPVMDLHNSLCPVLGKRKRCFSANPATVAKCGEAYVDAHRDNNVITVLKHFPGHGNSRSDSHLGIADVSRWWKPNELIPYQTLIEKDKVDAIMTAHIINTKLEPSKLPATLSKKIITDKLRIEMGYKGVIITDDMQMGAIAKYYGFKESIKKAILAGVDILMFSNNIAGANQYSARNVHTTIKKMVLAGEIPISRIDESFERIMKMKAGLSNK